MSGHPEISVIVPLFNEPRFIEAALSSVQNQSIPVAEIIVIDDGSTDESPDLAEQHASRPRVIHQTNKGPAAARNRGIQEARSPFIAFIDSDDLWRPDKLALQCAAFADDPDLVTCFGKVDFFWEDPDSEKARAFEGHKRTTAVEGYVSTTILTRKSAFDTVGLFDETLTHADSILWCSKLRDMGVKTRMLDEVVLDHRMHDTNLTWRKEKSASELLALLRQRRLNARQAQND